MDISDYLVGFNQLIRRRWNLPDLSTYDIVHYAGRHVEIPVWSPTGPGHRRGPLALSESSDGAADEFPGLIVVEHQVVSNCTDDPFESRLIQPSCPVGFAAWQRTPGSSSRTGR